MIKETRRKIFFTARTPDAWTHRAVLETADGVEKELGTCALIDQQNAFVRGVKIEVGNHYTWPWLPGLARDIAPLPDTFVYIEGAFRPNSERLLALLAGTQLYQTPLAGRYTARSNLPSPS